MMSNKYCIINLQTVGKPIQHHIAWLLAKTVGVVRKYFISDHNASPDYQQVHEELIKVMKDLSINKVSLVKNIDEISNNVANEILNSLQVRLEPHM